MEIYRKKNQQADWLVWQGLKKAFWNLYGMNDDTVYNLLKCYLPQPLTLLDIIYHCSLICIHVILPWLSCHAHLSIFPYDQDGLCSCEDINWLHGIWKAMQWRPGVNWNPLPPGKFLPKEKSGQLANPDSQKWQNSTKYVNFTCICKN